MRDEVPTQKLFKKFLSSKDVQDKILKILPEVFIIFGRSLFGIKKKHVRCSKEVHLKFIGSP